MTAFLELLRGLVASLAPSRPADRTAFEGWVSVMGLDPHA